MFDDYCEGLDPEVDAISDINNEAEPDLLLSEADFYADVPNELTEGVLELEEISQGLELADELQENEARFEDEFENRINSMTLADLRDEREHLLEIGAMNGEEIAEQYESAWRKQEKQDETGRFLSNLDKVSLYQLRQALVEAKDIEGEYVEDTDDTDDEPPQLKLSLRRHL